MEMVGIMARDMRIQVNVGVVIDNEFNNWIGKVWLSCINISLSDFYASRGHHYKTRLLLINARDSKEHVGGTAGAALDMIKNKEVQAILGPTTSTQAAFIIKLGEKAQVPVISFSASSPSLTSVQSPYFFQATQNDKTQVEEITSTIQAFGWTEAVPIYIDNEYGMGILPYLIDALQAIGIHIPYKSAISPWASDDEIMEELYKLKKMEARVFIVHMFPSLGARLFSKAKEVGMMTEGYVWIMSDGMTNSLSSLDPSIFDSVYGVVLGVKPYVSKTKEVEKFQDQWKRKFNLDYPDMIDVDLNIYGLWAYDAATALAMAIEKVFGNGNFCFQKKNISSNLTDLETLGVSENGPELAQALSNTSFKGLTGDFHFVNQQLQPSPFQIFNINGKPKGIELSIKEKRLVRKLYATTNPRENSPSLPPSAQPMDLTCEPMELEIQKKNWLRIGVPVKEGFLEFVKVRRNPITNKTTVSGYCIDVFDAAMKGLPNAPPYCYIPFAKPDGESAGSYDKLVYQVFIGNYSAEVGDVSIIASRSHHVDFTLPYMEYGDIKMIVTAKDSNKTRDFLKPLTWQLWLTSIFFFVYTGFVVWVLEHRTNKDFQGICTGFWFAFSIMFFSFQERVNSKLTRLVVIISCFVVLLLIQSYTAALSSYLTLQQLRPSINDVNELIKMKEKVGYQEGSFVFRILKSWGFDESKLIAYKSAKDCSNLLSKGSKNGGIAAAFEEMPYIDFILEQNCSQYEVLQPKLNNQQFQTDGFGFVFPKGSDLAPDILRQILSLIETERLKQIEKKWFGRLQKDCSADNSTSNNDSNRLELYSFWVLFLFAAIASFLALMSHAAKSVCCEKRREENNRSSNNGRKRQEED